MLETKPVTTAPSSVVGLEAEDRGLLLDLLRLRTTGPLETAPGDGPPQLWAAQRRYAEAARRAGFRVVRHAVPDSDEVFAAGPPLVVRQAIAAGPEFLSQQPSLVLRLGPDLPAARTLMVNVHLDTVAGGGPVGIDDRRVYGRGAIDALGPAVALLAGLRAAAETEPALGTTVSILVQAVSGEEGGAMGTVGTLPLVRDGFTGRLNVFCEPTGGRYLSRATAAATARITVAGRDAVDDRPGAGHNATVLLGALAAHLGHALSDPPRGGQACVAGLHTGTRHNRVYGEGQLLVNLGYPSTEAGRDLVALLESALPSALAQFAARFGAVPELARTARDATTITRLVWLKRDLPALDDQLPCWAADLLAKAAVPPAPPDAPGFGCDAIWLSGMPDTATIVYGPGDLAANQAHADGEYADHEDLARFAAGIGRIAVAFARIERLT